MTDRLFADTNVLIYAMDPSAPAKRAKAVALLSACAARGSLVTSPQTLNECYRVLIDRRRLVGVAAAREFLLAFSWTCTAPLDWQTIVKACEIADSHRYGWWDCLMLASAVRAGCRVFFSEDLQSGVDIEGMTIVDPFVDELPRFVR